MMRPLATFGVLLGTLLTTSLAKAEAKGAFGQQGEFIVSADRLVPVFSFVSVSQTIPGVPAPGLNKVVETNSQTAFSLLLGGTPGAPPEATFFTFPRLGLDYVVVPRITIGGDLLFYATLGGNSTTETDFANGASRSVTVSAPSTLVFGVAPRGGYILPLSDLFSLWLRGGFSFYTASTKTQNGTGNNAMTTSNNTNQLALDLDPQIVVTPLPHIGITAGLTADIPIAGGHSVTVETPPNPSVTNSAGSSIFYFGAELGILVWF
jgi:hypothetical protein